MQSNMRKDNGNRNIQNYILNNKLVKRLPLPLTKEVIIVFKAFDPKNTCGTNLENPGGYFQIRRSGGAWTSYQVWR